MISDNHAFTYIHSNIALNKNCLVAELKDLIADHAKDYALHVPLYCCSLCVLWGDHIGYL